MGAATALLITLFLRKPQSEVGHGRLPATKEDGGHPEVLLPHSIPEDQGHPQVVLPPSAREDQLPLYDAWGLPMLDHFEERLSPDLKRGKAAIAAAVAEGVKGFDLSSDDCAAASSIARMISKDSSDSLIGMTLSLENVTPFHSLEKAGQVSRVFRIRKLLGESFSASLVEAEDTNTHELFVMRFFRQRADDGWDAEDPMRSVARMQEELHLEEMGAENLCGTIPANMVASKLGVSVPLYTADIAGVPGGERVGDYLVLGRVQLSEMQYGTVLDLLVNRTDVIEQAQEYIARRLLQIVLKIQQSGLTHSSIQPGNILLRPDGSIVVADIGSLHPFGSSALESVWLGPEYQEPQLSVPADPEAYEGQPAVIQPTNDIWSLGINLYEIFVKRRCPFGYYTDDKDANLQYAQELVTTTESAQLKEILETKKVPPVWMDLILRLLEPNRERRITAWGIVEEFPELVNE
ncbi:hypothetical protein EBH_0077000 [Eimeria brunetti]|uniref:Protein kinase domain-containing protein n=1 Tax=Eimeria brunetti TaxID=51314 RepID=U6LZS0_9EIME|nr:hypothetical protein EBH_0077000 [Eimeria brunetti]